MGIDIGALFGQAEDAVKAGMGDLLKQGGNAGLGYLEGQAIAIISADQAQHNSDAQAATTAMLQNPSTPGSFGAYLSNLLQAPAIKQFGGPVVIAMVFIGLGGFYLATKGK